MIIGFDKGPNGTKAHRISILVWNYVIFCTHPIIDQTNLNQISVRDNLIHAPIGKYSSKGRIKYPFISCYKWVRGIVMYQISFTLVTYFCIS